MDQRLRSRLWRILAACAVMSGCLWLSMSVAALLVTSAGWRIVALAGLIGIGIAVYGAAVLLFGAARLSDLKGMLRRRK